VIDVDVWHHKAAVFIAQVWSVHAFGFGFIGSKRAGSQGWKEHSVPIGITVNDLAKLLALLPRNRFDLYFCPNAFSMPRRKEEYALRTPYAWVDIDRATPGAFDPSPGVLIRTSPGRYQGLWPLRKVLHPSEAEDISRALAYEYGADRNGWTVTKYLRVPYTYNHKPEYDRPRVALVRADWSAIPVPSIARPAEPRPSPKLRAFPAMTRPNSDWEEIYERYKRRLGAFARAVIEHRRQLVLDRSRCIYAIIADMDRCGASHEEIASVLWHNVYFVSKHGQNVPKLNEELSRVLRKLRASRDRSTNALALHQARRRARPVIPDPAAARGRHTRA
jgi:hypothetical protein